MYRTAPLRVNVRMAALASLGLHEEFGVDLFPVTGRRGAGEEIAFDAGALKILRFGRHFRILNAMAVAPSDFPLRPRRGANRACYKKSDREPARPAREQKDHASRADENV